jgi:Zn-finger nucleic acid-binding protein
MFTCPRCQSELTSTKSGFGLFWVCPSCKGRAITFELIRKLVPNEFTKELWVQTVAGQYPQKRKCPSCSQLMAEVPITINDNETSYDTCKRCHIIWFDKNEYEQLPKIPVEPKMYEKLTMEQREKLGLAELAICKERQETEELIEAMSYGKNRWIRHSRFNFPSKFEANYLILKLSLGLILALVMYLAPTLRHYLQWLIHKF